MMNFVAGFLVGGFVCFIVGKINMISYRLDSIEEYLSEDDCGDHQIITEHSEN